MEGTETLWETDTHAHTHTHTDAHGCIQRQQSSPPLLGKHNLIIFAQSLPSLFHPRLSLYYIYDRRSQAQPFWLPRLESWDWNLWCVRVVLYNHIFDKQLQSANRMHRCSPSLAPAGKLAAHYNAEIGLNKFSSSSPLRHVKELTRCWKGWHRSLILDEWKLTVIPGTISAGGGESTQRANSPNFNEVWVIKGNYVNCCSVLTPNLRAIVRKEHSGLFLL